MHSNAIGITVRVQVLAHSFPARRGMLMRHAAAGARIRLEHGKILVS
jgi:hypothetical protein